MKSLLVPNDLNRNRRSRSMVSTAQYLTERSLSKAVQDFVTIGKMVMIDHEIVTAVVVVAVIVRRFFWVRGFLRATGPDVVDGRVIKNFLTFVFRQVLTLATLEDS